MFTTQRVTQLSMVVPGDWSVSIAVAIKKNIRNPNPNAESFSKNGKKPMDRVVALRATVLDLIGKDRFSAALDAINSRYGCVPETEQHRLIAFKALVFHAAKDMSRAFEEIGKAQEMAPSCSGHYYYEALWAIESQDFHRSIYASKRLIENEIRGKSRAFTGEARIFLAYGYIRSGDQEAAIETLRLLDDDASSWLAGRLWSKSDLISMAKQLRD